MTTITLPDSETMRLRLNEVFTVSHVQDNMFPTLLAEAGETKQPLGVILMLQLAISDYAATTMPLMETMLNVHMPDAISALIDDEAARTEALGFWCMV